MTKRLEFLFDFASLNAYLAYRALPPMLQRTGAELVITPCLLGGLFKATGNQAPFVAFAGVKGKLAYEMLEIRRFVARHGLTKYQDEPAFPGQHADADARPRGGARRRRGCRLYRDGPAGHVGRGPQARRPAGAERAHRGGGSRRAAAYARTRSGPTSSRSSPTDHGAPPSAAPSAFPRSSSASEMFFGKERLGQVEEELARAGA